MIKILIPWFAIPFSSGPHFVRPLHHDAPVLASPQAWLSFIELDKAVFLVWLDWLVFCEYGFSVSALCLYPADKKWRTQNKSLLQSPREFYLVLI